MSALWVRHRGHPSGPRPRARSAVRPFGCQPSSSFQGASFIEDTLTKGEQSLVRSGREATILDVRHKFQEAMRAECVETVEGLTGRSVLAMMSANHVDPDLGAELFLLAPATA